MYATRASRAQESRTKREGTKEGTAGPAKGSRSILTILFMTVFLDFLGFSIVLPYLYFQAQSLGASELQYGLLLTSFSLMQLVFVPVLGRLSDRYGRRRILLVSLFGSGLTFVLTGLAGALWILFAARIVAGITDSTLSVAQAYVADVTAEESRLKEMGIMGAATALGFTVGPAVGGILSSLYGYAVPAFLAAGLAFANLVAAFVRLPESRPAATRRTSKSGMDFLRTALAKPQLVQLIVAGFTANLAFTFLDVTMAPWLQITYGYGPLAIGLIFLYVSTVSVVTQAVVLPRLNKRFSPGTLLVAGLVAVSVSFAGFGIVQVEALALAMGAVLMFGFGLASPSLSHLISVNTDKEDQGGVLGVNQSISSLARVVAPSLAVSIFTFGITAGVIGTVFLVAAVINAVPLVLTVAGRRSLAATAA